MVIIFINKHLCGIKIDSTQSTALSKQFLCYIYGRIFFYIVVFGLFKFELLGVFNISFIGFKLVKHSLARLLLIFLAILMLCGLKILIIFVLVPGIYYSEIHLLLPSFSLFVLQLVQVYILNRYSLLGWFISSIFSMFSNFLFYASLPSHIKRN